MTLAAAASEVDRETGTAARREPIRHLSTGSEGTAVLARTGESPDPVEIRYATVARTDPARWLVVDALARTYALLRHPNWRPLLTIDTVDGLPILVFEGAVESTLAERMGQGPLPRAQALALWRPIVSAIAEGHRLGLVHGKLGPSAVRLRSDGTPILDFPWLDVGAATSPLDAACAPPESGREPLDTSSDVFALGALLRLLLLGPSGAGDAGDLEGMIRELTSPAREDRPPLDDVAFALARLETAYGPTLPRPARATGAGGVEPGMTLGRFRIGAKVGEGGMGEVFRAVDAASGSVAAIKVLRADASANPESLRRFRKEARILREIRSPYIANLIEINHDRGIDYLALEFVEGTTLTKLLESRGGRVAEDEALAIVADACRGLIEAHARGVVHRDLKPDNLLVTDGAPAAGTPRVRVCDFGIARALDGRGGTLAITEQGIVLGTPAFMAPEQCAGQDLSPATDVYALGVTLFLLLSGRTPFEGTEALALLVAHRTQAPPELGVVRPDVSEATSALVARMLEKTPADRPADASLLLDAIQRIQHGESTSLTVHPQRPIARLERIVQHVFEWELKSSPEALWPFVSNTDRLNRAVHLPPALFERIPTANAVDSGVKTVGSNRIAGVSLRWQEFPFEWVEGRRWGVLRVFERGVMRWFTITLELFARPGGGTLLRYTMTLEPVHWFGRLLVAFEMRWKQRKALGKAFARIDAYVAGDVARATPATDAFETPAPLGEASRAALRRHLTRLREGGVEQDVLDALAAFCERAPDQEIGHLRPLAFARAWSLDPDRVVDACLRAAHDGLFTLLWEVLCPLCRVPADFAESLRALADHGRCPSCNVDFPLDFAQSLELVFRVSADVRANELRTYCVGGPAFAPHVVAQVRLAPGERLQLPLALANGSYKVRSPQLSYAFSLQVSNAGRSHKATAVFTAEAPGDGGRLLLAPGSQAITIENALDREVVARVERTAPREDALTAARAACLASFRRLFPGEVLASGRLVAVGHTAFVVTSVHDQRRLLGELGDARAFELVLRHLRTFEEIVASEGGAVVRTGSGTTLAAFDSASSAARAAVTLRERLDAEAGGDPLKAHLDIRIVVHEGSAVAATFDDRLDYFGHTVETALDLLAHAPPERVLLSSSVAEDPHTIADMHAGSFSLDVVHLDNASGFGVVVGTAHPLNGTLGA